MDRKWYMYYVRRSTAPDISETWASMAPSNHATLLVGFVLVGIAEYH
jgi:hypothetical protein